VAYNYTTVTGSYGSAVTGHVTFLAPQVTDLTGTIPIQGAASFRYTLSAGSFTTAPLLSTDNLGLLPAGWAWRVRVDLTGTTAYEYPILLPATPSTVTLSALPVAAAGVTSLAVQIDSKTADIQPVSTTASAGSVGLAADSGHVHANNVLIGGTNFAPVGFGNSNSAATFTANELYLATVQIPAAATLTGLVIENGSTATGNILAGLYNAAGTSKLAASASTAQSGTFAAQKIPFASTYAAAAGTYIFAVVLSSASSTASTQIYASPTSATTQGGFSLPTSVTPPSGTTTSFPAVISY
jgi:hypothetical protein